MITRTFEAIRSAEIISAVSHLSSFTTKRAAALSSVNQSMVITLVKKMNKVGAISVVGKRCGVNEYKVSKNALEIIDEKFNEPQVTLAKDNSIQDFKCEMRVVEKANVAGMGCLYLKRLDRLLAGVRA
ncbi:hypothetical protein G3341_06470 [Providencia vermicola]|uniref:hypothetical protein n=1 Tax=Providencia vermicola TaxID=333965 RepID=UPI0013A7AF0D|nr:hypothetical protein [Providencia vermicola]QIC15375.1 hypothetical protein G3341_06470 [Providencia vermicola]